jgi:hypothetical protein
VFFELSDDPNLVYLAKGEQLSELLAECIGFVFYVLSLKSLRLYCFNDHDVLIVVDNWAKKTLVQDLANKLTSIKPLS